MAKCAHFNVCGIEADTIPEGGHCILHAQDPAKDQNAFAEALEKHLATGTGDFRHMYFCGTANFADRTFEETDFSRATFEEVSFRGVTFNKWVRFRKVTFNKFADFIRATFNERADFQSATFERAMFSKAVFGEANFYEATFKKRADFQATFEEAVFLRTTFKEAYFYEAAFERADFTQATFNKEAYFRRAKFSEEVNFSRAKFNKEAVFSQCSFRGSALFDGRNQNALFAGAEIDFRNVTLDPPDAVAFRNADLSRVQFLNTDVREIEFTSVIWCRKPSTWFGNGTICAYDELVSGKQVRLERLYRELKQNYEDRRDYGRAGDFHFREKEMRKLNSNTSHGHKVLLWLYWAFSGYGERIWPPVAWLFAVVFGCAVLYLAAGITPAGPAAPIAWSGYGSALLYSAQTSFLVRPDGYALAESAQWVQLFQTVLSPILLGLIALAVRQRLKR